MYLTQQHQDTSVSVALVVSKTRVSPLKQQTIPKLELFAALLTSKLLNAVAKDLAPIYAWTDNSIVLGWLSIHTAHWKVFVSHRVSQIIDVLSPSQWRRVPTRDNPADHASCGLLPLDLVHCSLWWDGPQWLQQPPSSWPSPVTHRPVAELPEARTHITQANELDSFPTLLCQSFSSHCHLLRAVSWVRRFIQNSQLTKDKRILDPLLTPTEVDQTANLLLHLSLLESFPDVYSTLKESKPVTGPKSLCSLNPLLGRDGLILLGDR